MRVIDVINRAVSSLPYSAQESKAIAVRVLIHIANLKSYTHLVEPNLELSEDISNKIEQIMQELEQGRPIQYALGFEEFYNLKFNVKEGVLIPRPETEELVRLIIDDYSNAKEKSLNILDICTGSGCIAWSLAYGLNSKIDSIFGCDISSTALNIATSQLSEQEEGKLVTNKPQLFLCDILAPTALDTLQKNCYNKLDIIVSNPPYVCNSEKKLMRNNVLDYEPHIALFVPDKEPLIFYSKIAELGKSLLKSGGRLYFEINERYGEETKKMMEDLGYCNTLIIKDFNSKERMIVGVIK